jgi:hypothetical protein
MQNLKEEKVKCGSIKKSAMTVTDSICISRNPAKDIDMDIYCTNSINQNTIVEIWTKQHPLINTWMILSSASICILFALFFITF